MTTLLDVLLFKLQDEELTTTSSLKNGITINDIRVEYLNELIEKYNEGTNDPFLDYLQDLMYNSGSYIMVNLVTEVLADYYSQDVQEVVQYVG